MKVMTQEEIAHRIHLKIWDVGVPIEFNDAYEMLK